MRVAALYVQSYGIYYGIPDVTPWSVKKDATRYQGPWPVVAHPPCTRWCRLAGLVQKRWGHKVGDDGGTFAHALEQVRRWGGVLEHPAFSKAWDAYGLPKPDSNGGWTEGAGGYSCYVEQGRYGHLAKKATWLFAAKVDLPELRWGYTTDKQLTLVSWCGNRVSDPDRPRLTKKQASATPLEFRDILLDIARSARL